MRTAHADPRSSTSMPTPAPEAGKRWAQRQWNLNWDRLPPEHQQILFLLGWKATSDGLAWISGSDVPQRREETYDQKCALVRKALDAFRQAAIIDILEPAPGLESRSTWHCVLRQWPQLSAGGRP